MDALRVGRLSSQVVRRVVVALLVATLSLASESRCPVGEGTVLRADIIVYGGTAGGVVAAVAAARMNATVILLNPTGHLGGMVSGGLGNTDGHDSGGIAAEFFARVGGKRFAPSAAEAVFNALVNETGGLIKVLHHCTVSNVSKRVATLKTLTTTSGAKVISNFTIYIYIYIYTIYIYIYNYIY